MKLYLFRLALVMGELLHKLSCLSVVRGLFSVILSFQSIGRRWFVKDGVAIIELSPFILFYFICSCCLKFPFLIDRAVKEFAFCFKICLVCVICRREESLLPNLFVSDWYFSVFQINYMWGSRKSSSVSLESRKNIFSLVMMFRRSKETCSGTSNPHPLFHSLPNSLAGNSRGYKSSWRYLVMQVLFLVRAYRDLVLYFNILVKKKKEHEMNDVF